MSAAKEFFKSNQTFVVYLVALVVGIPVLYYFFAASDLEDMWISLILVDAIGFAPIIAYTAKHIFGLTDFVPKEETLGGFHKPVNYWEIPPAEKEEEKPGYEYVMVSGDALCEYEKWRIVDWTDSTEIYELLPKPTQAELLEETRRRKEDKEFWDLYGGGDDSGAIAGAAGYSMILGF